MDPNELTPQNAPRDLAALTACTPYQLRRLAESGLAGLRNEAEKMAWFSLKTSEARAGYILELLKRWDAQNGGAAHTNGTAAPAMAAPEVTRAPVASAPAVQSMQSMQSMQPVMPGVMPGGVPGGVNVPPLANGAAAGAPFIPQVAPSAVAAATAAAGEKPRRAPRTTGAPATADAAPNLGADVINLLTRILEGQAATQEAFTSMQKQVTGILEDASSMKSSRVETLEGNYLVLQKQVEGLTTMAQGTNQMLVWALMAIATSNPGASPLDVLRSAIQDSESFPALIAQARGKV